MSFVNYNLVFIVVIILSYWFLILSLFIVLCFIFIIFVGPKVQLNLSRTHQVSPAAGSTRPTQKQAASGQPSSRQNHANLAPGNTRPACPRPVVGLHPRPGHCSCTRRHPLPSLPHANLQGPFLPRAGTPPQHTQRPNMHGSKASHRSRHWNQHA